MSAALEVIGAFSIPIFVVAFLVYRYRSTVEYKLVEIQKDFAEINGIEREGTLDVTLVHLWNRGLKNVSNFHASLTPLREVVSYSVARCSSISEATVKLQNHNERLEIDVSDLPRNEEILIEVFECTPHGSWPKSVKGSGSGFKVKQVGRNWVLILVSLYTLVVYILMWLFGYEGLLNQIR